MLLTSYEVDSITRLPDGTWYQNTAHGRRIEGPNTINKALTIPCGKCLECRLQYSRMWAARCMMEASLHDENYFLTLTYDDEHLPGSSVDADGVIDAPKLATLRKKDFQDFMKRLRKDTEQKLRYFAAGEYGSTTLRPHYHAIVFGLHLVDLVPYKQNGRGDWLYNSDMLDKIWSNGRVIVGECTFESAAYTARYVVKKALGDASEALVELGFEKEFVVMSRKPGLAKEFYEQHIADFARFGCVYLPTEQGNLKIPAPRYFKTFLETDDPDQYFTLKENAEAAAEVNTDLLLSMSSKDYLSMCRDREEYKKAKIKALERSL